MGLATLVFLLSLWYLCSGGDVWIAFGINIVGFGVAVCLFFDGVRDRYQSK